MKSTQYQKLNKDVLLEWTYDDNNFIQEPYKIIYDARNWSDAGLPLDYRYRKREVVVDATFGTCDKEAKFWSTWSKPYPGFPTTDSEICVCC